MAHNYSFKRFFRLSREEEALLIGVQLVVAAPMHEENIDDFVEESLTDFDRELDLLEPVIGDPEAFIRACAADSPEWFALVWKLGEATGPGGALEIRQNLAWPILTELCLHSAVMSSEDLADPVAIRRTNAVFDAWALPFDTTSIMSRVSSALLFLAESDEPDWVSSLIGPATTAAQMWSLFEPNTGYTALTALGLVEGAGSPQRPGTSAPDESAALVMAVLLSWADLVSDQEPPDKELLAILRDASRKELVVYGDRLIRSGLGDKRSGQIALRNMQARVYQELVDFHGEPQDAASLPNLAGVQLDVAKQVLDQMDLDYTIRDASGQDRGAWQHSNWLVVGQATEEVMAKGRQGEWVPEATLVVDVLKIEEVA